MSRAEKAGLAAITVVGLALGAVALWSWFRWEVGAVALAVALVLIGTSKW